MGASGFAHERSDLRPVRVVVSSMSAVPYRAERSEGAS